MVIPLHHIFSLWMAFAPTFGEIRPFFTGEGTNAEFGLPKHTAISKPAQSVMLGSARGSATDMALITSYLQGSYATFDTAYATLLYMGLADAYLCCMEEVFAKPIVQAVCGVGIRG